MDTRSLAGLLVKYLHEAKELHGLAVKLGQATDGDWEEWYGKFLATKITPFVTVLQAPRRMQAGSVTFDIDPDTHMEYPVTSRLHVGE